MKLAILADVHSNLEALRSVMDAVKKEAPDKIVFLGDAVGYGANPKECCELLRGLGKDMVLGNHDAALMGRLEMEWFADHAKKALEWTMGQIEEDHLIWLATMRLSLDCEGYYFSHGSPQDAEKFDYILEPQDAAKGFLWMEEKKIPVVFVGHSHIAVTFVTDNKKNSGISIDWSPEVTFYPGRQYIVSVGSVGQPRDNDYRACYGVLDTEKMMYVSRRIDYDAEAASEKIRKAGLPEILSARLLIGR